MPLADPPPPPAPQVAGWLLEDPTANMCYMADGANSQQKEIMGQLLFRRNKKTGRLDSRVISISSISDKTAEGQRVAYKNAMAALAESAEAVGLLDKLAERPGGGAADGAGSSSDPPAAVAGSSIDHAANAAAFFERRRQLRAHLRDLTPVSSMNDRAVNGRKAARLVRGAEAGDAMPMCAEHATVTIGEAE